MPICTRLQYHVISRCLYMNIEFYTSTLSESFGVVYKMLPHYTIHPSKNLCISTQLYLFQVSCIIVCLIKFLVYTKSMNSEGSVSDHGNVSLLSCNSATYKQEQSRRLSNFRMMRWFLHPIETWDVTIKRLIATWIKAKRPFHSRFLISKHEYRYMSFLPLSTSDVWSTYPLHYMVILH